jgi:hypothetical protein
MADRTLLEGVFAGIVETPRLRTHLLTGGDERGEPVFFVHGNVSSSRFFEETSRRCPARAPTGAWPLICGGSTARRRSH